MAYLYAAIVYFSFIYGRGLKHVIACGPWRYYLSPCEYL